MSYRTTSKESLCQIPAIADRSLHLFRREYQIQACAEKGSGDNPTGYRICVSTRQDHSVRSDLRERPFVVCSERSRSVRKSGLEVNHNSAVRSLIHISRSVIYNDLYPFIYIHLLPHMLPNSLTRLDGVC